MNRKSLQRHARWAEKIASAQRQLADELAAELARAESQHDPLASHIYQARASYRRTSDADHSKSGRRTEEELHSSYAKARNLGFQGSIKDWADLMRCGRSSQGA
jgi:hypothetical protein